ncbi:MAG: hypothetical protein KIT84_40075 [Labilithrix sp.]|nr:hypothetical protein [Labilithrix sp.]MCW5817264.1 hypothetical protein [Labilithrix sp.]
MRISSRLKHRLGAAVANTPLVFIGAVIAIAVVFRIGIGAVKPAAAAPEEDVPRPSHVAVSPTPPVMPAPTEPERAKPAAAAPREPDPTATAARPHLPRRKPRTHGKR